MKNILFRVDSSSSIGAGHLMRTLTLAKELKKVGFNIIYASLNLNGNLNKKVIEAGFELYLLSSNSKSELLLTIKSLNIKFLVIDNYQINFEFEKYLKDNSNIKILSFDDTYQKHYCDILLNHNVGIEKKEYKNLTPHFCKILVGSKYTLIRDEFRDIKSQKRVKEVKNIVIMMGSLDRFNISYKVAIALERYQFNIKILTTNLNRNLNELKNLKNVKLLVNEKNIAKVVNESDLAIIPPSVSSMEIIYMKIPFIAILTAENQYRVFEYLSKKNFYCISEFNEVELIKYIDKILNLENYTLYLKELEEIEFGDRDEICKYIKEDLSNE